MTEIDWIDTTSYDASKPIKVQIIQKILLNFVHNYFEIVRDIHLS